MLKKRATLLLLLLVLLIAQAQSFRLAESSYVRYSAEVIGDHSWQGEAPVRSMVLELDPTDVSVSLELSITVMASDFESGNWLRDQNARRAVFEVGQFPEIRFSATSTTLAQLLPGVTETSLQGLLELHGVSQTITIPIVLDYQEDRVQVNGSFVVSLSDYNMRAPSVLGRTVADSVAIDVAISAILN